MWGSGTRGQRTDEMAEGPSGRVEPPKATPPVPHTKTSSVTRKRRVVGIGDSLLRGTENPIQRLGPTHREVFYLPGAQIRDTLENSPD